jgi:hypothetical protein
MHLLSRVGQMDPLERLHGGGVCGASWHPAMESQGFGNLVAYLHDWIQRGHRLLEHHRQAIASDSAQLLF